MSASTLPEQYGNAAETGGLPTVEGPACGSVAFVGAGPGDPELLTVRGAELIAAADLVLADPEVDLERLLPRFPGQTATVAAVGEPGVVAAIAEATRNGARVVRLVADPATSTCCPAEVAACMAAGVAVDVVPGVPPSTAVPAFAGVPLGTPELGDVAMVDAHAAWTDWAGHARSTATLVINGSAAAIAAAATQLVESGRDPGTPASVTVGGTSCRQRTVVAPLSRLAADITAAGLEGAAIAVVGATVADRQRTSWFESKALFGWRVLVPRTKEQAGVMTERLLAHGGVPVEVPTIAVEPPRTPQQVERAVRGLVQGRYQWVVFTSLNAVRAVREKFELYGLDARAFAGVQVAAVGEQTANALRSFGVQPDLVPPREQSSAGLVEVWPQYDEAVDAINRVFLPRADIATDTLCAGIKAAGWDVEDVTAYRTVRAAPPAAPIREAIKTGGFDAVLFTSSSTVRNLVGIAGKPHASTVVACIGPATARTAEEHGLRVDVLAPVPSVRDLVDAVASFALAERRAAVEAGTYVPGPGRSRVTSRRKVR